MRLVKQKDQIEVAERIWKVLGTDANLYTVKQLLNELTGGEEDCTRLAEIGLAMAMTCEERRSRMTGLLHAMREHLRRRNGQAPVSSSMPAFPK